MAQRQPRPSGRRIPSTPKTIETSVLRQRSADSAYQGRTSSRERTGSSRGRAASPSAPACEAAGRPRTVQRPTSRQASHVRSASSGSSGSRSARTPRKALIAVGSALLAVAVLMGVDLAFNAGKIYPGVSVAGMDVSGMTPDEAVQALKQRHGAAFDGNVVTVFADQDTADRAAAGEDVFSELQIDEETTGSSSAWRIDAHSLGAHFDPAAAAQAAYEVGRKDGGIPGRFSALANGKDIALKVDFDDDLLERLAGKIDSYAGDPLVDSSISVQDGVAYAIEGHDGMMVDRTVLADAISDALLDPGASESTFVANVEFTNMRIDLNAAQQAADHVNASISYGVDFMYGDQVWHASPAECGAWIATDIVHSDGEWILEPVIDSSVARAQLKSHVLEAVGSVDCSVVFEPQGDDVVVHASAQGQIPLLDSALEQLTTTLFGWQDLPTQAPSISVPASDVPASMTFDQAVELGVVSKISSFTTEYTDDYPTRNHNIHLMADYLDGSVAKAHSDWSMLDTSGEISEAAGYQAASQIVDGELVDDFGGGVCQVATTVFNAVYESGFPVPVRHNHSLYMSSYPDGRDAAIAWSYLDLVWSNDSDSDVLVRAYCTDTTVTIELWGVDPGYSVESETGEWSKGEDFKVKVKYDPELSDTEVNESKKGKDGSSISVTRKVYASDGSLYRTDVFSSTYDPVNRIVTIKGDGEAKVMTQDEFKTLMEKRKAEAEKKDSQSKTNDSGQDASSAASEAS